MVIEDETPPAEEVAPCEWRTLHGCAARAARWRGPRDDLRSGTGGATARGAAASGPGEASRATDAGVPLVDRGEGQLTWPAPLVAALQQSTLPSLLRFWHARLGELLSGGQPFDPTSRPRGAPRMVARGQRGAQAEDAFDDLSRHEPEADPARLSMSSRHAVPPTQWRLQRQRLRPRLREAATWAAPRGRPTLLLAHGRRPDARCHPFTGRRAYAGRSRALPGGRARGSGLRGCPACLRLGRAGAAVARPPPPPRRPCCARNCCWKKGACNGMGLCWVLPLRCKRPSHRWRQPRRRSRTMPHWRSSSSWRQLRRGLL